MKLGVDQTKKTLDGIFELCCDAIVVVKGGIGLSSIKKIVEIIGDVKQILENVQGCLPELMDLEPSEVGELGAVSYGGVLKIIEAVKGK